MGIRKNIVFISILTILLNAALFSADVSPFTIVSARANALGGTHAALADDFSALFSNPAGFVSAKEELSAAEISLEAHGPLFDLVDSVTTYTKDGTLDLSGLVGAKGLKTGLDMAGPVSFGYVGRGLGFGVFNRTYIAASAEGTTIEATTNEDLLLVGGYAFRFSPGNSHDFDIGFLAKGFLRGSTTLSASILTVTDLFDTNAMLNDNPFVSTAGIGVDLGARYTFAKTLSAAVVCRDLYSPALISTYGSVSGFIEGGASPSTSYGKILPRLDVGLSYTPRFAFLERFISGLVFAADYRDILDLMALIPRNPILNAAFGMELVLLDVLSFRAGISDALPSAGFGLDMRFMRLDVTMRGIEYGLDPGANPVFAMDLGLLFRY